MPTDTLRIKFHAKKQPSWYSERIWVSYSASCMTCHREYEMTRFTPTTRATFITRLREAGWSIQRTANDVFRIECPDCFEMRCECETDRWEKPYPNRRD